MVNFKLRYCKSRMSAYIHGELSPQSRRRIARYIHECPQCYAEYTRQNQMARELRSELPGFGRPTRGQLDRIWAGIEAEIAPAPQRSRSRRGGWRPYKVGYGVVALALLLAVMLPAAMRSDAQDMAAPPIPALDAQTVATVAPEVTAAVSRTQMVLTVGPGATTAGAEPEIEARPVEAPGSN